MVTINRENTLLVCVNFFVATILATRNWILSENPWNLETGIILALASLVQLITGLRRKSSDPENDLLTSLQLTTGLPLLSLAAVPITGADALLPIFSFSALVSALHLVFGWCSGGNSVALVAFLWLSCWAMEITNLFTASYYKLGTAAMYTVLAAVTLYIAVRSILCKVKFAVRDYKGVGGRAQSKFTSNHLLLVVYFCQMLPLIPALFLLTNSALITYKSFALPATVSGLISLVCWVVLLRYDAKHYSLAAFLYGSLWLPSGLSLLLKDANVVLIGPLVVMIIAAVILTFLSTKQSVFHILYNFVFSVLVLALTVQNYEGRFFLVMCWVMMIFIVYAVLHFGTLIAFGIEKVPLGKYDAIAREISGCFDKIKGCCSKKRATPDASNSSSKADLLGFSKYADVDMVGFLTNTFAGASALWGFSSLQIIAASWMVSIGGVCQFVIGCVSLSRGKTFQSCSFLMCSIFWIQSGLFLVLGWNFVPELNFNVALGQTGFLLVALVLCGLSTVISKAWFSYSISLLVYPVISIVFSSGSSSPLALNITLVIIVSLISIYCYFAHSSRTVFEQALAPVGKALVQIVYGSEGNERTVLAPSREATGISQIAEILNKGGIAALPTDTVYVLVAACKFPEAVERAYNTKKQAGERPMSMWISNLNQISPAKAELGPVMWRFMQTVWPSSISLVVPKGPWLQRLGLGDSEKFIGKPDSIAVRMPDYTVTSHLIEQVGPIAVTSANPSGEADTTHHSQVLARLGTQNCDGVLCDGTSPENAASTVVDCRRINEGQLGFFRIGITPKSRVLELFEKIQQEDPDHDSLSPTTSISPDEERDLSQLGVISSHVTGATDADGGKLLRVEHTTVETVGVTNPAFCESTSDFEDVDLSMDSDRKSID